MGVQSNELRIGNLFRFISTDSIEEVVDIKTAGLKTPVINNVSIKDVEPITLTEEWLLKFGFEDDGINGFKKENIIIDDQDRVHIVDSDRYGIIIKRNLKHVNQLQNLYFALTGKELVCTT